MKILSTSFYRFFIVAFSLMTISLSSFAEMRESREDNREHVHLQKGSKSRQNNKSSPLLLYHGGSVIHASTTMAIFWGPQWNTPSFAGDKISGIDLFFAGFNTSTYASTATEYFDSTNGYITEKSWYLGHVVDSSAAPTKALSTNSAVAEACKIVNNNPDPSALYLIYTATGAGQVNYCAWHSWGRCAGGRNIQVAYLPNLDKVAGCDPQDTSTGHSQGLAAIANVTAHELLETITDPRGTAWFDASGNENGDKCAWSFPITQSNPRGISSFTNGSTWKLQMEWSNSAYNAKTGRPNTSGQLGCIF